MPTFLLGALSGGLTYASTGGNGHAAAAVAAVIAILVWLGVGLLVIVGGGSSHGSSVWDWLPW
ncbi:hypothetical protein [Streptomyces sp. NPDC059466]|uniref:hypothetical protein n=1 Tax=unclassified Streptomyces TaxID=2593676 RepID=UPI003693FB6D